MQIAMNTVVTMTYELKDADGVVLESSTEPVSYLHGGYDNIFPKVEEAMHGKNVGDVVIVDLQPADAFGEYVLSGDNTCMTKLIAKVEAGNG